MSEKVWEVTFKVKVAADTKDGAIKEALYRLGEEEYSEVTVEETEE